MNKPHVALLRGVNVGGKHLVPMPALVEVFTRLGCADVCTYIQSGNVTFTLPPAGVTANQLSESITAAFGFTVPVVLRSQSDLARIVATNPYAGPAADPRFLHTVFLAAPLSPAQVAALRAQVEGDEQLTVSGRELYLSLPHGSGRSRLASACIAPRLPATNTTRSWPTVLKLAALLDFRSTGQPLRP